MAPKRKKADHLEDQCRAWLARRKEQPITKELIDDFCVFLWKNKMKSDLAIMRDMISSRKEYTIADL